MVCFKPLFYWSTIFLGNLPIWLSGSLTKMSESKIGKLAIDGQLEKTKAWCAIFLAQLVFVISLNFKNMYTQFVSKRKINITFYLSVGAEVGWGNLQGDAEPGAVAHLLGK